MADKTLRRGKSEDRTHFERAKDNFDRAKGETRVAQRNDVCPECGAPMSLTKSSKGESYRFEGVCSANPDHNIERYGWFSNEGSE